MSEIQSTTEELKFFPFEPMHLFGRTVIYSSIDSIDESNLPLILQKIADKHRKNSVESNYLWEYRNGNQPILKREKKQRPDICNKIVVNRASEITDFKVGYYVGEPIQYTSKNDSKEYLDAMERLNRYMYAVGKPSQDQDIVEWNTVCGTAYRLILPATEDSPDKKDKPFEMYTLDPRYTFVVYSTKLGNKKVMAGTYYIDDEGIRHFTVYTTNMCYYLDEFQIVDSKPFALGIIPIFEYPANNSRIGAFEIALPLLDELNNVESNRMDGIEQTIQAFIKFINCNIDDEKYEKFLEKCAIVVNSTENGQADVDVVTTDLDQNQTETTKQDIYNSILDICGVPSRTANASGDSTGTAIILRNGWETAEARARVFENMFKQSEREMLELVLKICKVTDDGMPLNVWDIETKFTRRNYEAIVSKANVLVTMLDNPKIHPILAFEHCGMFTDPEGAYMLSDAYYKEMEEKYQPIAVNESEEEVDNAELVRTNGQVVGNSERTDKEGVPPTT